MPGEVRKTRLSFRCACKVRKAPTVLYIDKRSNASKGSTQTIHMMPHLYAVSAHKGACVTIATFVIRRLRCNSICRKTGTPNMQIMLYRAPAFTDKSQSSGECVQMSQIIHVLTVYVSSVKVPYPAIGTVPINVKQYVNCRHLVLLISRRQAAKVLQSLNLGNGRLEQYWYTDCSNAWCVSLEMPADTKQTQC